MALVAALPAAAPEPENPGAFQANDTLDEGVFLVAKLQHGEQVPQDAIGTRARRKTVKVICVSACPSGGHFATGSDDGLCRVWEDEEDERLVMVDQRGKHGRNKTLNRRRSESLSNGSVGTCKLRIP